MNLDCLFPLIKEVPAYIELVEALRRGQEQKVVVLDAAKPYLIACLYHELRLPILVITSRSEEATQLQDQLVSWSTEARVFPEPDALPYERLTSDPTTVQQRMKVLSSLAAKDNDPLIIACGHALASKTLSPADFRSKAHIIRQGMKVNIKELLTRWHSMGYEWQHLVEVPGNFARRGGILDIYSPSCDLPARIELFSDEVESIRLFDPLTQRSQRLVPSITIVPFFDSFDLFNLNKNLPATGNLIDYLPQQAVVIIDQPVAVAQALEELDSQAREMRREQIARGELPTDLPTSYLTWNEISQLIQGIRRRLSLWSWQEDETSQPLIPFRSAPSYGGNLAAFLKDTKRKVEKEKKRIIIVSHQAKRLSELLEEEDIIAPALSQLEKPPRAIALVQGSLARGWSLDSVTIFTDAELFGFIKKRRRTKRHLVRQAGFLFELTVGDYVVHIEHGIARFAGTTMMAMGEMEREYLVLEYAANDKLYVPSDQVDRVGRYIGPSAQPPALSRLGTHEWARAKQRVRQAAGELAKELLSLYAAREVITGFSFSPDTVWQEELEASFPYLETPDQVKAVIEIKEDMERAKPMDRLICGDVGYGKTEVALRAAFKAVMDGAQVALLVPTTVLAQQHFQTFKERLSAFPINVEVLSRFRSEREQQEIIAGLKQGTIDIVIGTHRLLQKDVSFNNLELVIIDEEQRFGVAHKEHLKNMRKEVDVLTMTATPIPRTLYMALSEVRDMSTMETPPEERLPIKTYISEYDERLIREAILRELDRGGQVFFVHNRVSSIRSVASRLMELVPEAEIAIAHGQMAEDELESIMLKFTQGKIDILVSTTIIESGLDIPNVNTLIVNDADKLGLAQLYQLRGRVGRGTNRAYAYFLYGKGKQLTPQAERRLKTIFQAAELGAGFHIAMRDLEIRGAGNILGPEQSGHIGTVGFDLYCRLLEEAVEELRAGGIKRAPSSQPPTIDLPLSAHIPEHYVTDIDTRLALYHRLAKLAQTKQVDDMTEELCDRFGPMPLQVKNLLYAVKVKIMAMDAGVASIATDDRQVVIKMVEGKKSEKALSLGDGIKMGTTQVRLDIKRLGQRWQKTLEEVLKNLG